MDIKLNAVQYAQVEHIIKKIAKENNIDHVLGVSVEVTPTSCSIKYAEEEKADTAIPKEELSDIDLTAVPSGSSEGLTLRDVGEAAPYALDVIPVTKPIALVDDAIGGALGKEGPLHSLIGNTGGELGDQMSKAIDSKDPVEIMRVQQEAPLTMLKNIPKTISGLFSDDEPAEPVKEEKAAAFEDDFTKISSLDDLSKKEAFLPAAMAIMEGAKTLGEEGVFEKAKNTLPGGDNMFSPLTHLDGIFGKSDEEKAQEEKAEPTENKEVQASADADFTKFSSLDELNKYALDAYNIGQGAGKAWDFLTKPYRDAGNFISDAAGNFWKGFTGKPQEQATSTPDPQATNAQMMQEASTVNGGPGNPGMQAPVQQPAKTQNVVKTPAPATDTTYQSNMLGLQQVNPADPYSLQANDYNAMTAFNNAVTNALQQTDEAGNPVFNPEANNMLQAMAQEAEQAKQNGMLSPDFDASYYLSSYAASVPQGPQQTMPA